MPLGQQPPVVPGVFPKGCGGGNREGRHGANMMDSLSFRPRLRPTYRKPSGATMKSGWIILYLLSTVRRLARQPRTCSAGKDSLTSSVR